jgi:hypothetical protein
MNKFVAQRSTFLLALSWFFAVAFLNDAANLTDIFPDTATLLNMLLPLQLCPAPKAAE